jgi:putative Holliday junction resolvase
MLATPWQTVEAGATPKASAGIVAELMARAANGDDSVMIGTIVVGLPKRLNGDDNDQTAPARAFADALAQATGIDVQLQDERLTSHEAESRLAVGEKDWRRRKAKLDAAAAAIILQDYLDRA